MTEELKKKLTERFEQLKGRSGVEPLDDEHKWAIESLLKAYLAGGQYGYEIGIDEAKGFMSKCIWGRCVDTFHVTNDK